MSGQRYSVLSVTGWEIVDRPNPFGRRQYRARYGQDYHKPVTTWYVVDLDSAAQVIAAYDNEDDAREFAFQSNAAERAWEKQREHLIEELTS